MPRVPGKFGRRPPKNAPALRASHFLTGEAYELPPIPTTQDNLALLHGGWQMLGNDVAGDCNSVTWANTRRLVTAVLTGTERYPSQDMVWRFYETQNPHFNPNGGQYGPGSDADQGMEIQTGLEFLHKAGGPDGVKAIAFAKVDHTDIAEVKAAIAVFGSLWLGITVTEANQEQFSHNNPWDYVAGSRNDGGHAVVCGGFGGIPGADEDFITWGEETGFTDSFWTHQVDEAWIVIWPEHFASTSFLAGVDVNALAREYQALTGKTLPVPPQPTPPAPTPTPVPAPPTPPDGGGGSPFWSRIRGWLRILWSWLRGTN